MNRIPDWLIYIGALALIWFVLSRFDERADSPQAPPGYRYSAPLLPEASAFDPEILVEVGPQSTGAGTAFAIAPEGWWLTARHVVDSCSNIAILVGGGLASPVERFMVGDGLDLALLKTSRGPASLALSFDESQFRVGQIGFHLGFPQGAPGEAASRLIGRERLVARGRYSIDAPVLTWAEIGRSGKLFGSLAGISGGPVLDTAGRVVGVTLAESVRRGRLYTATPQTVQKLIAANQVTARGRVAGRISESNYGLSHDKLRQSLSVAQVVCLAERP